MKRFLFAGVCLLISLTGCSFHKAAEDKAEIVVWHWMSDRQSAFQELAKKYEAETGIRVRFEVFPHGVYSQKINAAAAAKDLPELFGILGDKKLFSSFIKAGLVDDLTFYMNENNHRWKNSFIDISLAFNTFDKGNSYGVPPGIYAVPIDTMGIQFLYNKSLLAKIGVSPDSPPSNWEDFIKDAKLAVDKLGVSGFVCGWGENWLIYCLATDYAFNIMGQDKFFATLRGEVPYTDHDWIKVFSLFEEMRDSGILAPGIITMNNKEAEQIFASGRSLFSFNGSWGVNTYKQMNPSLRYSVMPPPQAGRDYPVKIWAGAGSSFVVSRLSSRHYEAIRFLKWLTEKDQQVFLVEKTRNLPSVKGCDSKVSVSMKQFLKNSKYFTHPNLWPLNEDSRVVEAINIGIEKIIIGEKTPQETAVDVDKVKQLRMERK